MINAATIKTLRANFKTAEERIAQVPAGQWVIVWHGSVLRTDGERVALLGSQIYCGSRLAIEDAARRFTAISNDGTPAEAMSAAAALARVKAENRKLLAAIPRI